MRDDDRVEPADGAGALLARKTWRTLEPLHGMVYFVPEAAEEYVCNGRDGTIGSLRVGGRRRWARSRPMWSSPPSSTSTLSSCTRRSPPSGEVATPVALVGARFAAVDAAFRRLLGDEVVSSDDMRRAAELAVPAAEAAAGRVEGRPLAAAHADVPWPSAPHLVLWHAQSILREYRGDGHIAELVVRGLSGLEALVTHAAAGDVPEHLLRATRGWPQDAWDGAVDALQARRITLAGRRGPLHGVGEQANAGLSRRGPTPWRRRPMPCWAKNAARSCGPGPARGARRRPQPP